MMTIITHASAVLAGACITLTLINLSMRPRKPARQDPPHYYGETPHGERNGR